MRFVPPKAGEPYLAYKLVELDRHERAKALQWFLDAGWKFSPYFDGYIEPEGYVDP